MSDTDADPIDTAEDRERLDMFGHLPMMRAERALDEVDRLRADNAALAAALEDIAEMRQMDNVPMELWIADAECASMGTRRCHEHADKPDGDPDEWCPVCVAEVAWCAWKLGVLG